MPEAIRDPNLRNPDCATEGHCYNHTVSSSGFLGLLHSLLLPNALSRSIPVYTGHEVCQHVSYLLVFVFNTPLPAGCRL